MFSSTLITGFQFSWSLCWFSTSFSLGTPLSFLFPHAWVNISGAMAKERVVIIDIGCTGGPHHTSLGCVYQLFLLFQRRSLLRKDHLGRAKNSAR